MYKAEITVKKYNIDRPIKLYLTRDNIENLLNIIASDLFKHHERIEKILEIHIYIDKT